MSKTTQTHEQIVVDLTCSNCPATMTQQHLDENGEPVCEDCCPTCGHDPDMETLPAIARRWSGAVIDAFTPGGRD